MVKYFLIGLFIILILVSTVNALDQERQDRLDFGYVLVVDSILTEPETLAPGEAGILKVVIKNRANFKIYDIRVQLNLSEDIEFLKDTSKRRIPEMYPGETRTLEYSIIASPDIVEGVYESESTIDYLNHIGTERRETDNFGIVVKGTPRLFVQIEETTLYKGKKNGEITVKFINNDVADIKFLTVELKKSEDYKILSPDVEYIGDLDSDDYESVDFKIKLNNEKDEILIPVKISYKDSLNNDFSDELNVPLYLMTAKEAGKQTNHTVYYVIIIIVILIIAYFIYRRIRKRRRKQERF